MDISQDYEDLFKILNDYKIKYLVVGAYAVIFYSEPRYTKGIDIWICPDVNDENKVYEILKEFGVPLRGVSPGDFKDKKMIFQSLGKYIYGNPYKILRRLKSIRAPQDQENLPRSLPEGQIFLNRSGSGKD